MSDGKPLTLIRADAVNGLFTELRNNWSGQLQAYEETDDECESQYIRHAESIVGEDPRPERYGIYLLHDFNSAGRRQYHGFLHANTARLPGTTGVTLRFNWISLSPRYDFEDVAVNEFARVSAGIVFGGVKLCQNELKADHFKLHLRSIGDRRFTIAMAYGLTLNIEQTLNGSETNVDVRGNWLHIDNVPKLET